MELFSSMFKPAVSRLHVYGEVGLGQVEDSQRLLSPYIFCPPICPGSVYFIYIYIYDLDIFTRSYIYTLVITLWLVVPHVAQPRTTGRRLGHSGSKTE